MEAICWNIFRHECRKLLIYWMTQVAQSCLSPRKKKGGGNFLQMKIISYSLHPLEHIIPATIDTDLPIIHQTKSEMTYRRETFEIIWLDFSTLEWPVNTFPFMCVALVFWLWVIPCWLLFQTSPGEGVRASIMQSNVIPALPMINLNWQCDIGFPPHSGINSLFLSGVKSEIPLTHLKRLDHLLWVIMKGREGQTHSFAKMTSSGVGVLPPHWLWVYRIEMMMMMMIYMHFSQWQINPCV